MAPAPQAAPAPAPPPSAPTPAPALHSPRPVGGSAAVAADPRDTWREPELRYVPPAGGQVGGEENVDAILRMLEQERIFEPPTAGDTSWASRKESRRGGTRVGPIMIGVWLLGIAVAAGGYYGWQYWIDQQRLRAESLRDQAEAQILRGDNDDLDAAIEALREALRLHPTSAEGAALRLRAYAQRALEGGSGEGANLRTAISEAHRLSVEPRLVSLATAVADWLDGRDRRALDGMEAIELQDDPTEAYLLGRLQQFLGVEGAERTLATSVESEAPPSAARLALAQAHLRGQRVDAALEQIEEVLDAAPEHLRASLWKGWAEADTAEPDALLSMVESRREAISDAAESDRLLADLVVAHALRRKGETDAARDAVERAVGHGATQPVLLVMLAREALAVGSLERAQQAATQALAASPGDRQARMLLASILLTRGDARRAMQTLASLSADDPEVLKLSASAALAAGGSALEAASAAMGAYLEAADSPSVEMRALAMRMRARMSGAGAELLGEAKRLTREAPGDPDAIRALAEVALAARDSEEAIEALERLDELTPDDPEVHFLKGRAKRMAGDAQGAKEALERAIALRPEYGEARATLGFLLLDMGRYEAADELYQGLARGARLASGGSASLLARVGRAEALLGLGRLADAKVQIDGIPERDRELPLVRVATARVAIADGRPADAIAAIRPLAQEESASADLVALYGDALYAADESEAAMAQYEAAIERDEASPEGLLGYARILIRAEKADEALDILDRAKESLERRIRPPALHAKVWTAIGRAHLDLDDAERARSALRSAVELHGVPPEAYFYLGEALSGENSPEARQAYERYLELAPEGPLSARAQRAIR